jgi:hypothetical protein
MPAGSTYTPIATTTLGSPSTTITFSSIPQTYTDIVIVASIRRNFPGGSGNRDALMRFNSDSNSNYSKTTIFGNGSSAGSFRHSNFTSLGLIKCVDANFPNGVSVVSIQNYSNLTTYKTTLSRSGDMSDGTSASAGLWRSTTAINQIQIFETVDGFAVGDSVTLYGIAAA